MFFRKTKDTQNASKNAGSSLIKGAKLLTQKCEKNLL